MSNVPNKTAAQRERLRLNDQRGIVLRTANMVHNPRAFARLRVEEAVPALHRDFEERQGRAHTKRRRRRVTAYAR